MNQFPPKSSKRCLKNPKIIIRYPVPSSPESPFQHCVKSPRGLQVWRRNSPRKRPFPKEAAAPWSPSPQRLLWWGHDWWRSVEPLHNCSCNTPQCVKANDCWEQTRYHDDSIQMYWNVQKCTGTRTDQYRVASGICRKLQHLNAQLMTCAAGSGRSSMLSW